MADRRRGREWPRVRAALRPLRARWTTWQAALDVGVWLVAVPVAVALRFDLNLDEVDGAATAAMSVLGAGLFGVVATMFGLYRRRWNYGSFDEVAALCLATSGSGLVLLTLDVAPAMHPIPGSSVVIATAMALVGLSGTRYLARRLHETTSRPGRSATPVLIYGAGSAGVQLVRGLLRDHDSAYRPVGLLDDAPGRARLSVGGVRVLGGREALASAGARTGARLVVLAMPSAPGHVLRDLVAEASRAGLPVQTLPSLAELMRPTVEVADIRPITEADLLGRRQIDTDVAAIAGYVRGRRVLVTGAGGSIGSELCRQLCRFEPLQLVMLDRDESALHAVQLSIEGRALLDDPNLVVADIRDEARLHEVFERHQPQVVFHAAALKHLPLLEQHPSEGVKTNIWGTQHVLRAARSVGVARFVNISTDKAANPVSVLGLTKRVAERLTSAAAQQTGEPYLSVRFGNVLGSRGSVVPAFQAMIEAGGPVTVTDERVTRFFMTIPEAVQLVIQAGAIGAGGEVLILDMGEPVRIADIARRLIEASGKDVQIVYTGLRPGEKLHEDLVGHSEVGVQRSHPMITHAVVPPLAAWDLSRETMGLAELRSLAETSAPAEVGRARSDARGLAGFGARRSERRRRV